jgi:hypothetical protein
MKAPTISSLSLILSVHEAKLREYNNNVYWDPENDVVVLKHEKDPHGCDPRSFCNAYQASYGFKFDDRLKYMVLDSEVWKEKEDDDSIMLQVKGLEVAFILMDFKAMMVEELWEELEREDFAEMWNKFVGPAAAGHTQENRDTWIGCRFSSEKEKLDIKIVRSMGWVYREIASRQSAALSEAEPTVAEVHPQG